MNWKQRLKVAPRKVKDPFKWKESTPNIGSMAALASAENLLSQESIPIKTSTKEAPIATAITQDMLTAAIKASLPG